MNMQNPLARVRGKSPLDYFSAEARAGQQALCLELMERMPSKMPELIGELGDRLKTGG